MVVTSCRAVAVCEFDRQDRGNRSRKHEAPGPSWASTRGRETVGCDVMGTPAGASSCRYDSGARPGSGAVTPQTPPLQGALSSQPT